MRRVQREERDDSIIYTGDFAEAPIVRDEDAHAWLDDYRRQYERRLDETRAEMEETLERESRLRRQREEAFLEQAMEEHDTLVEHRPVNRVINIDGNIVILSGSDYRRMEAEWILDPDTVYYTYDNDWEFNANNLHYKEKQEEVSYFIE